MSTPSVHDMMTAYAQDAVDFANTKFGVTLDYSVLSVEAVEKIAAKLHDQRPKGLAKLFRKGPSDQELRVICMALDGYIGEVLRREKGGEWAMNEQFSAVGIKRDEAWIFPPPKVQKRLTNGAEDDLWFYFRVLIEKHMA